LLEKLIYAGEFCGSHKKKPVARPVFGFPLATEYNKTVAVDFHELVEGDIWYLYIIDE